MYSIAGCVMDSVNGVRYKIISHIINEQMKNVQNNNNLSGITCSEQHSRTPIHTKSRDD